jgi:hypothetical protein
MPPAVSASVPPRRPLGPANRSKRLIATHANELLTADIVTRAGAPDNREDRAADYVITNTTTIYRDLVGPGAGRAS